MQTHSTRSVELPSFYDSALIPSDSGVMSLALDWGTRDKAGISYYLRRWRKYCLQACKGDESCLCPQNEYGKYGLQTCTAFVAHYMQMITPEIFERGEKLLSMFRPEHRNACSNHRNIFSFVNLWMLPYTAAEQNSLTCFNDGAAKIVRILQIDIWT